MLNSDMVIFRYHFSAEGKL